MCRKFSNKPEEIFVDDKKLTLHGLQQYFIKLDESEKIKKLNDLLDALDFNQVIIFVRTRKRASVLDQMLKKCCFPSMCVHSNLRQSERLERYKKFKEYRARILVTTNLFGRGVDINRVNIVVNFDMTANPNEYLHRVGRAGRFGTKGLAITFLSNNDDQRVLDEIKNRFKVKITSLPDEIESSSYITN
jgi:ATP-dependent RNA helicase UAP56/SUB2